MPKRGNTFTAQLSFGVTPELRVQLIALGYLGGVAGQYAVPARNILEQGVRGQIEAMDERERAQFQAILENVRIQEAGHG